MRKLFTKMVVLYLVIMISTLTMLGLLLSFLLNNYFTYNKKTELVLRSSNISELVHPYLVEKKNPELLVTYLNKAEENLGTEMIVVDKRGRLIAGMPNNLPGEGYMINHEDIQKLQQGVMNIRQGKSTFYDESALWVTTPVFDDQKNVIGGVILYSPIMGVKDTVLRVRYLFIYSAVVSTILSAVVVNFMAQYVTSPLIAMNKAVQKMAKGDLTQRVKIKQNDEIGDLTETFNYMADQMERQEKVRREFVADVSHELRSPLTNIQGFAEAMIDEKDKTKEERTRYLGIIHKETMRMIRLVNELLDLSRLDSGNFKTVKSVVNLSDVIHNSLHKVMPMLKENDREVLLNIPDDTLKVLGDQDRLEQVVINLLDNANRYSSPNAPITVNLFPDLYEVKLLVEDEGKGISPEELPYIWERFYKIDKVRSRETGGTGLGLAIVKRIIENFGGTVIAESVPGKGSQIGFALPLYSEDENPHKTPG